MYEPKNLELSRPSDHIRAWVSGYSKNNRSLKPLAFLQAYFDDSASETGERRLFLAGYLHSADAWQKFSDDWGRVLNLKPKIKYLKMSEANALRGEFWGWSEDARDMKLQMLAEVIHRHEPISFHTSVSRESFEELVVPVAPYALRKPHYHLSAGLIALVTKYLSDRKIELPVDFIFDRQEGVDSDVILTFDELIKHLSKRQKKIIGKTPIFADDKDFLPLQAADFLAWNLRNLNQVEMTEPLSENLKSLLGYEHGCNEFDLQVLKTIGSGLNRYTEDSRPQTKSDWSKMKREIEELRRSGFIFPMGTRWKNFLYYARELFRR